MDINLLVYVFHTLNLAPDIEYIFLNVPLHIFPSASSLTRRRRPRAASAPCPRAAPCPPRTPPRRRSRPRASGRWTATRKRTSPAAAAAPMRMLPLLWKPCLTRPVSVATMTTETFARRTRSRTPWVASAGTLRGPSRSGRVGSVIICLAQGQYCWS